jgi:hypothetical protein
MTSSQHLPRQNFAREEKFENSFMYIIVTFLADLNCEIAG